jgi:ssDNA-binding Zn-finger/Zn-ribbon topoisomerase 1
MADVLNTAIDVPCPQCGRTLHVKLGDIQRGRTVRCSGGHSVTLKQEGQGIQKANKALSDLEKSIKQLNRSLRRK